MSTCNIRDDVYNKFVYSKQKLYFMQHVRNNYLKSDGSLRVLQRATHSITY